MSKKYLILFPQLATKTDVTTLKQLAWKSEAEGDLATAKQIWIRVLSASFGGADKDAVDGLVRTSENDDNASSTEDCLKPPIMFTTNQSTHAERSSSWTTIESLRVSEASEASEVCEISESSSTDNIYPLEPPAASLLRSNRGIDYAKLQSFLESRQWQAANEETERVMLKVARRLRDRWLDGEAQDRFPQTDLETINRLWTQYSKARFGFTVQAQIFAEVQSQDSTFMKEVAWKKAALHGGLLDSLSGNLAENLQFDLSAPVGHLPFVFGGEHCWIFERLQNV